ncbi:uncharacterized protein [Dysidea avara]|uniref:uncharacterized protein n=1 Tax=Dysidea avara TaxID=196820 RepID=UPI003324A5B6
MAEFREEPSDNEIDSSKKSKSTVHPGIIYLSRIPPYMKPLKIRHIFSDFGEIGRVFLQPEDTRRRQKRRKQGGNKKVCFTEGWVEFCDKKIAKHVAKCLNATQIGGKKRGFYHDDLWNIKYLPKFQWTHLTEKLAYEQAVKEQQMRTEISQARKENQFFLSSVEQSKALKKIEDRKRKRGEEMDYTGIKRTYKQSKTISNDDPGPSSSLPDELLVKVLPS